MQNCAFEQRCCCDVRYPSCLCPDQDLQVEVRLLKEKLRRVKTTHLMLMSWKHCIITAFVISRPFYAVGFFFSPRSSHHASSPECLLLAAFCLDPLLYPLVGNQPHAHKQSCTPEHAHRCAHTNTDASFPRTTGLTVTSSTAALSFRW